MTPQRLLPILFTFLVASCAITPDDSPSCPGGKCDGDDVDQTCSDARYGNGTCDMQLSCSVPDIDCFRTFTSDAEAGTWFSGFETALAAEEGRAPRAILPESDPRFAKLRAMLDRGWDAFRSHRPVGDLRDVRPALVLLDDPTINAFVIPDLATKKSAFSVQVQTGLLAASDDDDAILGVMMHELQHAVGLHLIGDTKDRLRTFYVASGDEPIGRTQSDDPDARASGAAWRELATQVVGHSEIELGGLPIGGELDQIFLAVINNGVQHDANACASSVALANGLRNELAAGGDPLDGGYAIDLSSVPARVDQVRRALRNECLAAFTRSFVEVVAALGNTTPAQIEAGLSAHDRGLVTGVHVIDAIFALTADRRQQMRDLEAQFEDATGEPWSALRYFSYEEDADDTSVTVLRAAHLDPAGQATFLRGALPATGARSLCDAQLAAGEVPAYGEDILDEHHATCWRVFHVRDLAAHPTARRRTTPSITAPAQPASRILLPRRLADQIAY